VYFPEKGQNQEITTLSYTRERISLFLSSYNAYFFEQHSANAVCVKMSHLL
uniref:Uncharacterized protein n=1 Tax=Gopherus agassizii TaxID=38772 RepID=A0A452HJ61_9SAUR